MELKHILSVADYTLCGFADDELDEFWIEWQEESEIAHQYEDHREVRKEFVKQFKQDKVEYSSNCRECIKELRRLKTIKFK